MFPQEELGKGESDINANIANFCNSIYYILLYSS